MGGQYDPELDVLYFPIGNPAPDFDDGDDRPGDNLYTSSVVALSPKSGELKWFHQQVPHDVWDYDVPSQPTFKPFNFLRWLSETLLSSIAFLSLLILSIVLNAP